MTPVRAALLVGGLAGCFAKPDRPGGSHGVDGGNDAGDPADATPCTPGEWGVPIALSSLNGSSSDDYAPALTQDKQTIVFHRSTNGDSQMYQATWNPGELAFDAPALVAVPNFGGGPYLFGDGLTLWYHSYVNGAGDIMELTRPALSEPFSASSLRSVSPFANAVVHERDIEVSANGLDAVLFVDELDSAEIVLAERISPSGAFSPYLKIGSLVDSNYDCCPTISSDGLTVMWEGRTNPYGIWTASRPSRTEAFGGPELFTAVDNLEAVNGDPHLSADGLTLVYTSRRTGSDFKLFMLQRPCAP